MYKYRVHYNGKTYCYTGEHCDDAAKKFERRKVYGNYMVGDLHTKLYDADTRGINWAEYEDKWSGRTVSIERADMFLAKQ